PRRDVAGGAAAGGRGADPAADHPLPRGGRSAGPADRHRRRRPDRRCRDPGGAEAGDPGGGRDARRRLSQGDGPSLPGRGPGMTFLLDTWHLFVRLLRQTMRMPVFVMISIVQPVLWVLLFGQLFAKVTTIAGFGATSYVQFLAPGISIMTALFGAAY